MAIKEGVDRPGALEKNITGISTKVLSERLRKLTAYGLLHQEKFKELPPRTVYSLTRKGKRLVDIVHKIHELDAEEAKVQPGGPANGALRRT